MRIIALVAFCIVLSGCQTRAVYVPEIEVDKLRTPPQAAMQACIKPSKLQDGSFASVAMKLKETAELLNECSSRKDELSEWIKRGE